VGLRKSFIYTNFEQAEKANVKCRLWNFISRTFSPQSFCRNWKVDSYLRRHLLAYTCNAFTNGRQDNSVSKVTSYGLDGPGIETRYGARFSVPIRTRHPPNLPYMRSRIFTRGVKRPRRTTNHPSPYSAEVSNRLELYFCHSSVPAKACHRVTFIFTINISFQYPSQCSVSITSG
jgi:hypothetical protein